MCPHTRQKLKAMYCISYEDVRGSPCCFYPSKLFQIKLKIEWRGTKIKKQPKGLNPLVHSVIAFINQN